MVLGKRPFKATQIFPKTTLAEASLKESFRENEPYTLSKTHHIGIHHQLHQFFKRGAWLPAQLFFSQ